MIIQMYCPRDTKTGFYHPPMYCHTDGHAMRVVKDQMTNGHHVMASHPGDFDLYRIGEFDDEAGIVSGHEPKFVVNLKTLQQMDQAEENEA